MTEYKIDINSFLSKGMEFPVLDVRSPAEFAHGHIPGSVNIPLFTNEERSIVGTLYIQKGSGDAMMKGLEIVGPKMKEFVQQANELAPRGELGVYCWRGGMRSSSMAWLLNTAGIKSHTLDGGYRTYRRYIHGYFTNPFNLAVIGGMTGSGKTEVLEEIERSGGQVIHLERLAGHKGSVFGHLGMPEQPTTEQFENDLFTALFMLDGHEPVFIEDESIAIGQVFIPRPFYSQLSTGTFIKLVVPFEQRVLRLVETYAGGDRHLLAKSVDRIEKRLGKENSLLVKNLIDDGHMNEAVEIVLRYYDKIYGRSMDMHQRKEVLEIEVNQEKSKDIADRILAQIKHPLKTDYS